VYFSAVGTASALGSTTIVCTQKLIAQDPMNINDLTDLIRRGESATLEFKRELDKNGTKIAAVAASFSNTAGGTVLFGIDDDGKFVGVEQPDLVQQRVVSLIQGVCNPPLLDVALGSVPISDTKFIVWMKVPRRTLGVCLVEEKCYSRYGPTTTAARSSNQIEAILAGRVQQPASPDETKIRPFPGSKQVLSRDTALDELLEALHRPGVSILAIEGISGIGKTTLAAYLSDRIQNDGYAVAWIECRLETTLDSLKLEVCAALQNAGHRELSDRLVALEGSPTSQSERLIDLLHGHKLAVVLNDYYTGVSSSLDEVLRLAELYSIGPQFIVTARVRPENLGIYNTSAVYELYLRDGLDERSCSEYLRICGVTVDASQSKAIWNITGKGHPKALQLFASRARRLSPKILLETLPVFRDSVKKQWLTPLLEELPDNAKSFIKDLAIFEKPIWLDRVATTPEGHDAVPLILTLVDRFICDLTSDGEISMHPMIREYVRGLQNTLSADLWASKLWIGDIDLSDDRISLAGQETDCLISAWSHAVRHPELRELATSLVLRLRRSLMAGNRYDQLNLLIDKTDAANSEAQHLFSLQKSKILTVWGQYGAAFSILNDLIPKTQNSLKREVILQYSKVLLGSQQATQAVEFLKCQRNLFSGLQGSAHSMRFLNRLIEALIASGNHEEAILYAKKTFQAANDRADMLQGATAARLLAKCYLVQRNAGAAVEMAGLSSRLFADASLLHEEALSRLVFADAYHLAGDKTRSIAEYRLAGDLFIEVGDTRNARNCEIRVQEFSEI
jgi:hypothetical protein